MDLARFWSRQSKVGSDCADTKKKMQKIVETVMSIKIVREGVTGRTEAMACSYFAWAEPSLWLVFAVALGGLGWSLLYGPCSNRLKKLGKIPEDGATKSRARMVAPD